MKPVDKLKFWRNVAIGVVIVAYGGNFAYALWTGQSGGPFGDTFGATNALFSGVALMMLIYTVILQREELAVIKEERDDTRKLLSGQEKINKLQEEALRKQIFEQSFNAMLKNVLDEKERLYGEKGSYVDNRGRDRTVSLISAFNGECWGFLKKILIDKQASEDVEIKISSKSFIISSLIYLDNILENNPEKSSVEAMRELISSIIDDSIRLWIVVFYIFHKGEKIEVNFFDFLERYKIKNVLPDVVSVGLEISYREAFEKFVLSSD